MDAGEHRSSKRQRRGGGETSSAGADLQGQREDLEHQQLLEQQQTVNDSAAALDPAAAAAAPVPAAPDSAAAAELAAAAVAQLAHMSAADQQVHASAAAAQHGLALHQQLDAAAAAAAAAAALGGMPNLSAGGLALDPAAAAALAAHGIGVAPLGLPGLLDASGQPLALLHQGLELAAAAGDAALFAQLGGHAGMGMGSDDMDAHRSHLEGVRKADYQALATAKRQGQLATIQFVLDLSPELSDIDVAERSGIIEVPLNGDVAQLKRLFQYQAQNKLLPALQTLLTETGEVMRDVRDDGSPMPLTQYGIGANSTIMLRISVPEHLDQVPMVDEALASAAYTSGGSMARTPSRKTRWTAEQIEALIEGVEKYGLSAWRTIVMDPRLASKNNMQCKDKFRNLCLTIIQGRPERGLMLPWALKDRVRALIEQEGIKGF